MLHHYSNLAVCVCACVRLRVCEKVNCLSKVEIYFYKLLCLLQGTFEVVVNNASTGVRRTFEVRGSDTVRTLKDKVYEWEGEILVLITIDLVLIAKL